MRCIYAEKLRDLIYRHHYVLVDSTNSRDYGMFTVGIEQAIDECPTLDVVSREQYNTLYDENLKLREANERLKITLHNLTDCWEED